MSLSMKAARLKEVDQISIEQIDMPKPKKGEVLLKVKACSICGSDLRTYHHGNERVSFPATLGHEMSGVVVEVGEGVEKFSVGDCIATGADIPSMEDSWSQEGMGNLSKINYAIGYQFPGGFAEYCLLNEMMVKYGPIEKFSLDEISFEEASLCEPLACCINGLERSFMSPGKSVLIIGAGPIGILLYKAAKVFGASQVYLADTDDSRIKCAKTLGIKNIINSKKEPLDNLIAHTRDGEGFNVVMTACPSPDAHEQAIELVSKRGVINLFGGLPKGSRNIQLSSNKLHYKEAYLTGSHGSTPKQYRLAMSMLKQKQVDVKSLITHRLGLNSIKEAFNLLENRSAMKVTIYPELDQN